MHEVRWLHISDLHFGQPGSLVTWDVVREVMLSGIRQAAVKGGPFDFVVATGDIAYSGTQEQYVLADRHLREILEAAGTTVLIVVPGNHDLERPQNKSDAILQATRYAALDPSAHQAAVIEESGIIAYLGSLFQSYSEWWNARTVGSAHYRRGLFPGDFSTTLRIRDIDVGIVGLNSAMGHILDADEGQLWIHRDQLHAVCGGNEGQSPTDWAQKHHLTLLLTHHPPAWLSALALKDYQGEIYTRGRFTAHLFGHTHESAVETVQINAGTKRTTIQARSFFGMESFRTREGKFLRRSHGFAAFSWRPKGSVMALYAQFREAKREEGGEWQLHTDSHVGGDLHGTAEIDIEQPLKALPIDQIRVLPIHVATAPLELAPDPASRRAVLNVSAHGDTDVLPFPHENAIVRQKATEVSQATTLVRQTFADSLEQHPPSFIKCLIRTGHVKYRWVTQIDPMWNLAFLAEVIAIAPAIEAARSPIQDRRVFSYRLAEGNELGDLFRRDSTWGDFQRRCKELAEAHEWVVRCDIGNFYGSISHLRLAETLEQEGVPKQARSNIDLFLARFSPDGQSLPVGGPAARILSEAVLAPVDQLLQTSQVSYCRYSDDFALFASSRAKAEEAHFIFVKTLRCQGLVAQDLKTRIVRSTEFLRAIESNFADGDVAQGFMKLRVHWDKYADPEKLEYNRIKEAVATFDILGMITTEVAKTRINEALTRKLVNAVRALEEPKLVPTLHHILSHLKSLTPVLATVLQVLDATLANVGPSDREAMIQRIADEGSSPGSVLLQDDAIIAYLVRLLARHSLRDLSALYDSLFRSRGELVRREAIHALGAAGNIGWLRQQVQELNRLSPSEQRALLMVSGRLGAEGTRLRRVLERRLSPFDRIPIDSVDSLAGTGEVT